MIEKIIKLLMSDSRVDVILGVEILKAHTTLKEAHGILKKLASKKREKDCSPAVSVRIGRSTCLVVYEKSVFSMNSDLERYSTEIVTHLGSHKNYKSK